jgi:hypothetical protein
LLVELFLRLHNEILQIFRVRKSHLAEPATRRILTIVAHRVVTNIQDLPPLCVALHITAKHAKPTVFTHVM